MIRVALETDLDALDKLDVHISRQALKGAIVEGRVLVAETTEIIGWLRYSYFWNSIPFMDMLVVSEAERGKGIGSSLIDQFEQLAFQAGHSTVMTSTAANEHAQHLYYRLGYEAVGGFYPRDEPYELMLSKYL